MNTRINDILQICKQSPEDEKVSINYKTNVGTIKVLQVVNPFYVKVEEVPKKKTSKKSKMDPK